MEYLEIDSYRTEIDTNGNGKVIISIDGNEEQIGIIRDCINLTPAEAHDRALEMLRINDLKVKEKPPVVETPKPKRKYVRHVHLGLASDYGKVELKLATPEKHIIKCYNLYLKGTNKYVYKLTDKGILVMENDGTKKTAPMLFTEADIKLIKNTDDFDIKRIDVEARWVRNKIAPNKTDN